MDDLGPVMDPDHKGRLRALRWVADPARLAASITALEAAQSIEAPDAVNGLQGRRELCRRRRQGPDRLDDLRLDGSPSASTVVFPCRGPTAHAVEWLAQSQRALRVLESRAADLTANARVVDGDMLTRIGDGNYRSDRVLASSASVLPCRTTARQTC